MVFFFNSESLRARPIPCLVVQSWNLCLAETWSMWPLVSPVQEQVLKHQLYGPDLQEGANGVCGILPFPPSPPPAQDTASEAHTNGRVYWWISGQTVTVIGNNFLLCQGIYMQISVSHADLRIPAINHYRLAHWFLAILRSYRQGCNIILNTLSPPSIRSQHYRKIPHGCPEHIQHCFCCHLGVGRQWR